MTSKNETYTQLAIRFKSDPNEKNFRPLLTKMSPGLKKYIYNIIKDHQVADDIFADVMAIIYYKIDSYSLDYQITTWAYRIAYNACMGHFRKKTNNVSMDRLQDVGVEAITAKSISTQILSEEEAFMTEESLLEEDETLLAKHQMAKDAIQALPPMFKPYVEELLINERSYAEIFDIMQHREKGINPQTVKNRIHAGRKILRQQLMQTRLFQTAEA